MPKPVDVSTPSDREIRVARTFDAPAELVWDCHTKPDLIRRWMLGPPGWSMPVCEVDLTVGGAYRYRWRSDADGTEFGSSGIHTEITPFEKIVTTERMEGFDGEAINTLVFEERDGRTTATITMLFASKEARDGALQSGMSDGMAMGFDRMDEILVELAAA
ncbi:MAG: SRPBCC family protein [Alphaproteobacteria bacterium]|nr:SRPBCC family protein [Alphaproteobacteria bacterium]MBU1513473.1 SRPBCC family protein [Alphaproteobacteria bacterium]MBU2096465.1 SRPBCC family protein [Alphaproteobacteria bacterium]MBU2149843.1 SRPBCC family protein [Alphaproteobacteria bacterium]MBU2308251.1 SRPBCC family protein [Alphaproteobacteria bacterium]